uniref:DUF6857 domain-containing protein n=1 Tax=Kalanchoe fedtschenkoi TaxID=63787 RepID=A0A7N0VIM9_KALFE
MVCFGGGTDDSFVASMFADLCESSENGSAGSVVETFLDLHLCIERMASTIDKLLASSVSNFNSISCVSQRLSLEISEDLASKNAAAWIQAAVETDFSKFCLYSKQDKKGTLNDEKSYLVVLEKTAKEASKGPLHNTKITRSQVSYLLNGAGKVHRVEHPLRKHSSAPRKLKSDREQWFSQNGLKDAACLAQKLIWVSRQWFLKYLETSLKKGFRIQGEDKSIQMTSLFGNLKRVNQWLEELVGCKHEIDERIEPFATNLALYFGAPISGEASLSLNTHLQPTNLRPFGGNTKSQVSFLCNDSISSFIA